MKVFTGYNKYGWTLQIRFLYSVCRKKILPILLAQYSIFWYMAIRRFSCFSWYSFWNHWSISFSISCIVQMPCGQMFFIVITNRLICSVNLRKYGLANMALQVPTHWHFFRSFLNFLGVCKSLKNAFLLIFGCSSFSKHVNTCAIDHVED